MRIGLLARAGAASLLAIGAGVAAESQPQKIHNIATLPTAEGVVQLSQADAAHVTVA